MIADKDRSGYFGASDVAFIVGNWKTKTWLQWWMQKIGANRYHFDNKYTLAGTNYEHKILQSLNIPGLRLDEQIIHESLKLRVNYDGLTDDCTYECKTYKLEKGWKMPKKYWQQVQVQMYDAYLRLLIFLLAILISACDSSSPAFRMMYFAHKLNEQGDNI